MCCMLKWCSEWMFNFHVPQNILTYCLICIKSKSISETDFLGQPSYEYGFSYYLECFLQLSGMFSLLASTSQKLYPVSGNGQYIYIMEQHVLFYSLFEHIIKYLMMSSNWFDGIIKSIWWYVQLQSISSYHQMHLMMSNAFNDMSKWYTI